MHKKRGDEKKYSSRWVFCNQALDTVLWAKAGGAEAKEKAKALPFVQIVRLITGPPDRSLATDVRQSDFADTTFSLDTADPLTSIDLKVSSAALRDGWVHALKVIMGDRLQTTTRTAVAAASAGSASSNTSTTTTSTSSTSSSSSCSGGSSGTRLGKHTSALALGLAQDIHKFQMEGYAQQFFQKKKQGIFGTVETIGKLLNWTSKPLSHSLNPIGSGYQKDATDLFKNIMNFMGDGSKGEKFAGTMNLRVRIAMAGSSVVPLRDELFCQIMKQVSGNPSKSREVRGWQLMATCSALFPPSSRLIGYLRNFASERHKETNEIGGAALYVTQQLDRPIKSDGENYGDDGDDAGGGSSSNSVLSDEQLSVICAQWRPSSIFGFSVEQVLTLERGIDKNAQASAAFAIQGASAYTLDNTDATVPLIMKLCMKAVLELGGDSTDGIFREASDADTLLAMQREVAQGDYTILENRQQTSGLMRNPMEPADLLKIWLRKMPEPLIPFSLYEKCVAVGGSRDKHKAVEVIQAVRTLSPARFNSLRYLCQFCWQLAQHENATRMSVSNLALVMAPNLLKDESGDPMVFARNAESEKGFVSTLIGAVGAGLW
jgi:hypothetical protein